MKKYARYEILVLDEWLTEDVGDVDISFLFELIERRYATKSTVLCTQYTPAEWHGRLGGGVQADAMVDRLVHGSVRIDLGDVNVRKLLAEEKQRYGSARRVIPKRREHSYANRETGDAHAA
ncbi:ATP-binding protein [Slackia exigua]|uniref:ATP-binding protein n=1 Tax=Slackia exigua TaxID=84109 RepID=UPI003AB9A0A8